MKKIVIVGELPITFAVQDKLFKTPFPSPHTLAREIIYNKLMKSCLKKYMETFELLLMSDYCSILFTPAKYKLEFAVKHFSFL